MSNYRRWYVPGGMVFFTLVTCQRRPILTTDLGRTMLRGAIETVREHRPFELFATVVMPDHWHLIMVLPHSDCDYSTRLKRIKEEFAKSWLNAGGTEAAVSESQATRGERGIWQPRFWEHTVQDEDDLERCTDYIHWNPRKHQLVPRVRDWPWSSFHRFVARRHYDINWGGTAPQNFKVDHDWGEP